MNIDFLNKKINDLEFWLKSNNNHINRVEVERDLRKFKEQLNEFNDGITANR